MDPSSRPPNLPVDELLRARRAAKLSQALQQGPAPSLGRRLLPLGALVLLLLLAAGLWWGRSPAPAPGSKAQEAASPAKAAPGLPKFLDPAAASARAPAGAADGTWRKDLLGTARDLRAVMDTALASTDPQLRRHASTAWYACFPLFDVPPGQPRSAAAALAAVPEKQRSLRAPAIQELHARCGGLLVLRDDERAAREAIVKRGLRDETLAPAGQGVLLALKRGDTDTARALLRQTLRARDPAALLSLVGLAGQLAPERPDAAAIDLALLYVACDNGLQCDRNSLAALLLCAHQGQCDGELYERWAQRAGNIDDVQVEAWVPLWRKALQDGEFPLPLPSR
jgi:hypothetical protein